MISTSPRKEKEAREHLGADHFIVSRNEEQMTVRPSSRQACKIMNFRNGVTASYKYPCSGKRSPCS